MFTRLKRWLLSKLKKEKILILIKNGDVRLVYSSAWTEYVVMDLSEEQLYPGQSTCFMRRERIEKEIRLHINSWKKPDDGL